MKGCFFNLKKQLWWSSLLLLFTDIIIEVSLLQSHFKKSRIILQRAQAQSHRIAHSRFYFRWYMGPGLGYTLSLLFSASVLDSISKKPRGDRAVIISNLHSSPTAPG